MALPFMRLNQVVTSSVAGNRTLYEKSKNTCVQAGFSRADRSAGNRQRGLFGGFAGADQTASILSAVRSRTDDRLPAAILVPVA